MIDEEGHYTADNDARHQLCDTNRMERYANFVVAIELSSRPTQKQIRDHYGERQSDVVIGYQGEKGKGNGIEQQVRLLGQKGMWLVKSDEKKGRHRQWLQLVN